VWEYPCNRNFTGSRCVKVHSTVAIGGCACTEATLSAAAINHGRVGVPQQKFFHLPDEVGLLVRLGERHVDVVVYEDDEPNLTREVQNPIQCPIVKTRHAARYLGGDELLVDRELADSSSSSRNAVNFSPLGTSKRFPSLRCASAIQIVRPSRSRAETQPQLQPALLKLSAIVSQYFTPLPRFSLWGESPMPSNAIGDSATPP